MDEIEAIEGMISILDTAEHVDAANLACMPLNRGRRIDDLKLIGIRCHSQVLARYNSNHGKQGPLRLPTLGAATQMIVGAVTLYLDNDRIICTFADEFATSKVRVAGGYAIVDSWVDRERCSHLTLHCSAKV